MIYTYYTDKELLALSLNAAQTPLERELTARLEKLLYPPQDTDKEAAKDALRSMQP